MKRNKLMLIFIALQVLILQSGTVFAKEGEVGEWSFSSLYGVQNPSLRSLNQGLLLSPLVGQGGITIFDENGAAQSTINERFVLDNPLPTTSYGGKAAFELQWHPNEKYSMLFGFASWERTNAAKQFVTIPSQGERSVVDYERRAKLTYTEFTLGGTAVLWQKSKYKVYFRGSVHEVFDIDYREDLTFTYIGDNNLKGNERVRTLQAQTAGLTMLQLGLGGEWFLQKWISLGIEAGYLKSERNVQVRGAVRRNDFIGFDEIQFLSMPYAVLPDGRLGYLVLDADGNPTYKRMRLDFSGWQVFFRMNIYY